MTTCPHAGQNLSAFQPRFADFFQGLVLGFRQHAPDEQRAQKADAEEN
jgi:hypothetical protein